jgi:hypothetical protein
MMLGHRHSTSFSGDRRTGSGAGTRGPASRTVTVPVGILSLSLRLAPTVQPARSYEMTQLSGHCSRPGGSVTATAGRRVACQTTGTTNCDIRFDTIPGCGTVMKLWPILAVRHVIAGNPVRDTRARKGDNLHKADACDHFNTALPLDWICTSLLPEM